MPVIILLQTPGDDDVGPDVNYSHTQTQTYRQRQTDRQSDRHRRRHTDTDVDIQITVDPKAAVVSRRKPPWNVLSHKPPQNF